MSSTLAKHAGIFSSLAGKLRGAAPAVAQEARAVSQAAHAAPSASTARTLHSMSPPKVHTPAAYAPTGAHPSQPALAAPAPAGGGWGAAPAGGGWGAAPAGGGWGAPPAGGARDMPTGSMRARGAPAARAPQPARSGPNPEQRGNPVDAHLPGFMAHDRRLREIQGKLKAREAAGKLTPQKERLQYNIDESRRDLHNQLQARAGEGFDTAIEPHLRQGREVAMRPGGLSSEDERELFARGVMPRKGTVDQRAQRMMPALSSNQYNRQAAFRGQEDPAMRAIAQTVGDARARNAMIPQAIAPKLSSLRGSLSKQAFLGQALKRFGTLAHSNPTQALAYAHAADQGLRGALYGGLIGGAGGALLSRPGDEGSMGLRGALLGALGGGGYGAYSGNEGAKRYLATPEGLSALSGRLSALRSAGAPLAQAFTS